MEKRKKGIYLLPNLFTTLGLFSGFYSIILTLNSQFVNASIAIFAAMVWDGFDGRIARLTNTQTAFGAEYDSLSDLISFGLAPALLAYIWSLNGLGKLGWLVTFVYIVCAALRLARFNTQIGVEDKKYFQGLASPAAASVIASFVWIAEDYNFNSSLFTIFLILVTALLMVSNIRYYSFKSTNLKNQVPFKLILFIILIVIVISVQPSQILFLLSIAYLLSGIILTPIKIRKKMALKKQKRNYDK